MKILVLHPIADWSVNRIAKLCETNGWELTIATIETSTVANGCPNLHEWLRVGELTDDPAELRRQIGDLKFDAVIPGNEFAVVASDIVAQWMGVYHNDLKKIHAARNKALMREAFAAAGIPQPKVIAALKSIEEYRALDWSKIKLPVIVKPVDMASSLFVRKCSTLAEVEETLGEIFGFGRSMITNYEFRREALIEEFAEGPEFSVECIVENGRLLHRIMTKKFVSPFPACFEIGYISGAEVLPQHSEALTAICEKIAAVWGMPNGVMHVEFKMTDEAICIIEAAARPPGDQVPELLEMRHNLHIEDAFIRLRGGLPWTRPTPPAAQSDWIGIRFSFEERTTGIPTDNIKVIRELHDRGHVLDGADAFSVDRRTGYVYARSHSFEDLCQFVGEI